jgi:hypothetical protein
MLIGQNNISALGEVRPTHVAEPTADPQRYHPVQHLGSRQGRLFNLCAVETGILPSMRAANRGRPPVPTKLPFSVWPR